MTAIISITTMFEESENKMLVMVGKKNCCYIAQESECASRTAIFFYFICRGTLIGSRTGALLKHFEPLHTDPPLKRLVGW